MLGSEAHSYFSTVLVWETQEGKKNPSTSKKCSDYYPFGLVMPGRSSNSANPNDSYKFTGHELDNEAGIGLTYAGARYLDNITGRWSSIDPLADMYPSQSPYNYGLNNPISNYDPNGEFVLSFLSGFARGIFSGKRFGASVNQGVGSVKNWAGIWSSFGRGSFGQVVSKFTWQLPQQLTGVLGGTISNVLGGVESISHQNGATLINSSLINSGAFTVGSIIQAPSGYTFSSSLIQHEYGHYLQSQLVGPAYLPFVALPSFGSFLADELNILPKHDHERFWTEKWSDNLSDRFRDKENGSSKSVFFRLRYRSLQDLSDSMRLDGACAANRCEKEEDIFENQDN